MASQWRSAPLSEAQTAEIASSKQIIYDGFLAALDVAEFLADGAEIVPGAGELGIEFDKTCEDVTAARMILEHTEQVGLGQVSDYRADGVLQFQFDLFVRKQVC